MPPLYPIGLQHGLALGAVLFALGMLGALTKRNAIAILMSIEVMLNGVIVTFVAFARHAQSADLAGQVFAIFIMTVAAADAAVGLAIIIAVYRLRRTVQVDAVSTLQG
jgi:NADH:ubiquinone oxidoreductase subunit K